MHGSCADGPIAQMSVADGALTLTGVPGMETCCQVVPLKRSTQAGPKPPEVSGRALEVPNDHTWWG